MDPRHLVSLLLDLRQTNPNRFLTEHHMGELQPTFSKWLGGKTSNPRRDWSDRVAKALGIKPAAMLDDATAEEEALRLGVAGPLQARESEATYGARRPRQARIDAGMLALQIGDLMRGFDQDLRDSAAPLFRLAATTPERAPEAAEKLRALLVEPAAAPGSTTVKTNAEGFPYPEIKRPAKPSPSSADAPASAKPNKGAHAST